MVRRNRHDPHATTPTDHTRRNSPAINGPEPDDLAEALDEIRSGDPTETPSVSAVRTLEAAGINFPLTVGNLRIKAVRVQSGKPMHGEMRSDDHISLYEVEFLEPCPEKECFSETRTYKYKANHHISGYMKEYCPRCGKVFKSEDW